MQTVYVLVLHYQYEGDEVIAVYSSREDALTELERREKAEGCNKPSVLWDYRIRECELR